MVETLKDFMSKMGTGSRSSEDLTYEESREAMSLILDQEVDPVSFGAFAVAARWKSQTPEELAGFLDEIRDRASLRKSPEIRNLLDVSGRFDGKVDSVNTEFAGSILASAAGANILTHTGRNVPTQEGTTFLDLVQELGWDTEPSLDRTENSLSDIGFGYLNQALYTPQLEALKDYRRSLGVRCFLNTIESMVNPFNATAHVGSFYHLSFADRVCRTFERCETQFPDRILMVQGIEGQTELRSGDCIMAEWRGDELIEHDVHTGDFELDYAREDLEEIGSDPAEGATLVENICRGNNVPGPYRESVAVNAGCRLYASDQVDSLEKGLELSLETLNSHELEEIWHDLDEVYSV